MTDAGGSRRPSGRYRGPRIIQQVFLVMLAMWVVAPFGLGGRVAQDAVPYVAAGKLVRSHPRAVYAARHGDLFDLSEPFRSTWCNLAPAGTDCENVAVAYVASPMILPLAVVLAQLGGRVGTLVMQMGAGLLLAVGMWLLWERLAYRTRHGGQLMLATAILLTPMAMVPIGLGQTSPILFLSVCVGVGSDSRRGRVGAAAAWIGATLSKAFPAALILLLVWRRRWRMLAWSVAMVAVLAAVALVVVPLATWGDFVRTTLELSSKTTTNPYNGSFNSLVARAIPGTQDGGAGAMAVTGICVAVAALIGWLGMRFVDDDSRWAIGYLALLFVTPIVWWHYLWVAIGALGVVLAAQRRLDDRLLAILPATALIAVIPSIPNARGSSLPVVQAFFLIAVTILVVVLARRTRQVPLVEV